MQKEIDSRDLKGLLQRIKSASSVLLERDFSWTRLLNALEEAQPYKVRLIELRPAISSRGVLIQAQGIAVDLENYLELQQKLQEHPMFRRVYPAGWSKPPGGGELVFNISFSYFPNPDEAEDGGPAAPVPAAAAPAGEAAGADAAPGATVASSGGGVAGAH